MVSFDPWGQRCDLQDVNDNQRLLVPRLRNRRHLPYTFLLLLIFTVGKVLLLLLRGVVGCHGALWRDLGLGLMLMRDSGHGGGYHHVDGIGSTS